MELLNNKGEDEMKLYAINFTHYSQKDSQDGIIAYAVAESDEAVYEWIKSEPRLETDMMFNSWKYREEDEKEYDICDSEYNVIGKESYKEHIIRVCGEMNSEYVNLDDLYYGITHYGWELIKENIQEYQINALMETIGLVIID